MGEPAHELLNNELQYITQCVAGAPFGGWYRVLQDGRIELLALGGIWRAPARGSLPQRQARAMLARLVRLRGRSAEIGSRDFCRIPL